MTEGAEKPVPGSGDQPCPVCGGTFSRSINLPHKHLAACPLAPRPPGSPYDVLDGCEFVAQRSATVAPKLEELTKLHELVNAKFADLWEHYWLYGLDAPPPEADTPHVVDAGQAADSFKHLGGPHIGGA